MANQVTITAKKGVGLTVTAQVIPNVTKVELDTAAQTIRVYQGTDFQSYDISGASTLTCTISGGTYAFTIS